MAGSAYTLFLDDSGDKDYRHDRQYSSRGGPTPLFVFAGLATSQLGALEIDYSMRALKYQTFGTPDVEIKANWLKRPRERKKRYLDKFNITDGELTAFTDSLYELINEADCQLVGCVVNKKEAQDRYGLNANHPPGIAYECVLQRAQKEMVSCGGAINVTIDHMTGATRAGNQHKLNLERQHERLKRYGSSLLRGVTFERVRSLSFRDSKDDERLQLADLIAYAIYRQFLDHGAEWEDPTKDVEVYEYLYKILKKFWNHNGIVSGYGIVKFPMNRRVLRGF